MGLTWDMFKDLLGFGKNLMCSPIREGGLRSDGEETKCFSKMVERSLHRNPWRFSSLFGCEATCLAQINVVVSCMIPMMGI